MSEREIAESGLQFTERGFAYVTFDDFNGVECTLQKSSIATEDCIWFGARDIGLKRFVPYGGGWKDVELENDPHGVTHVANNRMHLSREQVAALIPVLQRFAETGEITPPLSEANHEQQ